LPAVAIKKTDGGFVMRLRMILAAFLALVLFASSAQSGDALVSTAKDRKSVSLTIYNDDLALVKEVRVVKMRKGLLNLRFQEVASKIDATSVQVKPVGSPGFELLEQNYEFDLISPMKLMEKYVGKKLKIVLPPAKEGERERIVEATLLATNDGYVYQVGDEIYLWFNPRVILPSLPKDLVSRPTLVWMLKGFGEGSQKLEVSYLTKGFDWRCDYILTLASNEKTGDFSGWVTITNKSGATYRNAKVQLIAGEVHRAEEEVMYAVAERLEAKAGRPQFAEEAFFEYHLYTLNRKTTVKDRQTKQISLLDAHDVPMKKLYIVRSSAGIWGYSEDKGKVGVYIEFENSKSKNLGMALPKGLVRVYKADKRGQLQFIGEDHIDHTPVDEKVIIKLGEAFDIVYEARRLSYRQIASNVYRYEMEYEIRNHKDENIVVEVEAPLHGDWEILKASHEWIKETANRVRFFVPVKAKDKGKLNFTVQIRWL